MTNHFDIVQRKHIYETALLIKAGINTPSRLNGVVGQTLEGMASELLSMRGEVTSSMGKLEIINAAFAHTSGDFPELLSNVAHKSMLQGFAEANEAYPLFTAKGTLSDFKQTKRTGLGTFSNLDRVNDGGEYKFGTFTELGKPVQLSTYGKMFSVTRETILNDDIEAFTSVPRKMGYAAARQIGDLVTKVLVDANQELFTAANNNVGIFSLDVKGLDKAITMMNLQEDGDALLNIDPAFILCSKRMRGVANSLMQSQYDPNTPTAPIFNPVAGAARVISDARLDRLVSNGEKECFYLIADPKKQDVIEISYLDGNDKPIIEKMDGFDRDGVTFKVRIDCSVTALSHFTMLRGTIK